MPSASATAWLRPPCPIPARALPVVTLSIGVAVQDAHADGRTPEQLQWQADAALYDAKRTGRNRVALYQTEPLDAGTRVLPNVA